MRLGFADAVYVSSATLDSFVYLFTAVICVLRSNWGGPNFSRPPLPVASLGRACASSAAADAPQKLFYAASALGSAGRRRRAQSSACLLARGRCSRRSHLRDGARATTSRHTINRTPEKRWITRPSCRSARAHQGDSTSEATSRKPTATATKAGHRRMLG